MMPRDEAIDNRIRIGLSGWGDHDDLYEEGTKAAEKLKAYTRHLSKWIIRIMRFRPQSGWKNGVDKPLIILALLSKLIKA